MNKAADKAASDGQQRRMLRQERIREAMNVVAGAVGSYGTVTGKNRRGKPDGVANPRRRNKTRPTDRQHRPQARTGCRG